MKKDLTVEEILAFLEKYKEKLYLQYRTEHPAGNAITIGQVKAVHYIIDHIKK